MTSVSLEATVFLESFSSWITCGLNYIQVTSYGSSYSSRSGLWFIVVRKSKFKNCDIDCFADLCVWFDSPSDYENCWLPPLYEPLNSNSWSKFIWKSESLCFPLCSFINFSSHKMRYLWSSEYLSIIYIWEFKSSI